MEKLQIRGHHCRSYRESADGLSWNGEKITPESIALRSSESSLAVEGRRHDYSGGTEEGRKKFKSGQKDHVVRILTAQPDDPVLVNDKPDDTCRSCQGQGDRHCDQRIPEDAEVAEQIARLAQALGMPVIRAGGNGVIVPARVVQRFILRK